MYAAVLKAEGNCSRVRAALREGDGHDTGSIDSAVATFPARKHQIRLPKLSLQSFSGDITQWLTFWDSFKSAVHSNDQLTEVDKFNYLKSLLTGTAREAIAGLTLSASNYKEAVAILEGRFGHQQQIISRHMDQLLNMNPVTSSSNLPSL